MQGILDIGKHSLLFAVCLHVRNAAIYQHVDCVEPATFANRML